MNRPGIDNRQLALNIMHWLSRLLKWTVRTPPECCLLARREACVPICCTWPHFRSRLA